MAADGVAMTCDKEAVTAVIADCDEGALSLASRGIVLAVQWARRQHYRVLWAV